MNEDGRHVQQGAIGRRARPGIDVDALICIAWHAPETG